MNLEQIKALAYERSANFDKLSKLISQHEALISRRDELTRQVDVVSSQIAELAIKLNLGDAAPIEIDSDRPSGLLSSKPRLEEYDQVLGLFGTGAILETKAIRESLPSLKGLRIQAILNKLTNRGKLTRLKVGLYQLPDSISTNGYDVILKIIEHNPGIETSALLARPELARYDKVVIMNRLAWLRDRGFIVAEPSERGKRHHRYTVTAKYKSKDTVK